ncbi:MAG: hypothetical protein LBQ22_01710 [Bacteroidales bacterium]|jgi:hypothetical protein|nr:hypothetical protein [Bacteroidales bacterium]
MFFSCKNSTDIIIKPDLSETDFIYIEDNILKLKDEKYFPVMLNYIISCRYIDNEFVISPHVDYEKIGVFETNTKDEIEDQLRGHFQLIKEMGFNSIRLCFDRIGKNDDKYYYGADGEKFFINENYEKILNGLERAINIAEEKDLRVMLLIKAPINKDLEDFTINILKKFKDNPVIFSYDFINEPLYFDEEPNRKKTDACKIVSGWKKMMNSYAPNQMMTIGFSEPIEVFEWDPALLPVDFIAFHTYHPLRVKNEIYWYSSYVNKPWMIGETSLPAENDSTSYEDQAMFMRDIYQYVLDCGGIGFGWWDFQEAVYGNYEAKYTGILNHEGTTVTADGKHIIIGTIKPAAKEIQNFSQYKPGEKVRPVNYFNMMGYNNILIKGKILDKKTKEPVEGAVIRGWNEWWSVGLNTFTDENGEFTIYSNDECVNFEISAPKMTRIKFNQKLNYRNITGIDYDIKNLPDQYLEYHNISYVPFIKDSLYNSVFDFDKEKFYETKFVGEMGVLYLSTEDECK